MARRSGVYFKNEMFTDWTLMSALKKKCFDLREGQLRHIASNLDLIFCICFKAETLCIYVFMQFCYG